MSTGKGTGKNRG